MPTPKKPWSTRTPGKCAHCHTAGHRLETCPVLAKDLLQLVKRRHDSKAIHDFVAKASNSSQGCNVVGMEGVHGEGRKRTKMISNKTRNKTKRSRKKGVSAKMHRAKVVRQNQRRDLRQEQYLKGAENLLKKLNSSDFNKEKMAFNKLCRIGWAKCPRRCHCGGKLSALVPCATRRTSGISRCYCFPV